MRFRIDATVFFYNDLCVIPLNCLSATSAQVSRRLVTRYRHIPWGSQSFNARVNASKSSHTYPITVLRH